MRVEVASEKDWLRRSETHWDVAWNALDNMKVGDVIRVCDLSVRDNPRNFSNSVVRAYGPGCFAFQESSEKRSFLVKKLKEK